MEKEMKKDRLLQRLFLLFALGLVLQCGDSQVVARVGNHVILLEDVIQLAKESSRSNGPFSYGVLWDNTNQLVEDELIALAARREGLQKSEDIQERLNTYRDGQVYAAVIKDKVIDKMIPDDMVREKYRRLSKEYHVRHIFIPKPKRKKKDDPDRSPEAKAELEQLRQRLLRGFSFEEAARQFSKDSLSAGKGGDLGFLRWGDRGYDDAFFAAVSKLRRGQISPVVETKSGYHLVKLENVRRTPQQSFGKVKEDLRTSFYRPMSRQLDSAYYAFVDKIEKYYKAEYPAASQDSLLKFFLDAPKKNIDPRRDPLVFLDSLTAEQRALPLAVFKGGKFTVEDAVRAYEKISPRRRPYLTTAKEIKTFLSRNVPRRLITRYGYEKGYDNRPEIKKLVQREETKLLADRLRRREVFDKITVTDEEIEQFYHQNRHIFEKGAQVQVRQIVVKDEALAYEIYDQLQSGADFAELEAAYNEDLETKENGGLIGWLSTEEKGAVARTAARLNTGEYSKPLKIATGWAIIQVLDRKEGGLLDLQETMRKARREYRLARQKELMDAWLNQLKATTPIVINKSILKKEANRAA